MTGPRPVPENSTSGLIPIVGDHEVAVTGTEYRQAALAPYAPRANGRARHVAVELAPVPVTQGAHAGMSGVEVWLDGVRIGELTARFGQAYAPLVNDVLRRGGRPSCLAGVDRGEHGLNVVLHLPDLRAAAPPRPVVGEGVGPPAFTPRAAPKARSHRVPLLIGVAVVGVLGLATVVGVGGGDIAALATGAAAAPTSAAAPPSTPLPAPAPVAPLPPPPAPISQPEPASTPGPQPQPEAAPPPESKQQSEPEPTPRKDCNSNYSGCVPKAKDVDCEGGPGDGPKYVRGPLRVTGEDVYGLDGDSDEVACENGADDRG